MKIESNTGRYRAMSRKAIERALGRSSDGIVLHLRYAGSDVGPGSGGTSMPSADDAPPEI